MPKTFGETIREARRNKRLTAGEFAKKIGITQSALSKLENNQAKKVDPELVKRICKVLYIDANQLFNIEANVTYNYEGNIIYPFKKAEELKEALKISRTALEKLALKKEKIFELIDVIDSFFVGEEHNGRIRILCERGIITAGGCLEEDEMLYSLTLMSFWGYLYYEYRKISFEKEISDLVDISILYIGRILREQAIYGIRPNIEFRAGKFCKEFKNFIKTALGALGHKYDQIGHLTEFYDPEEAEELKNIRTIYETISFDGDTIKYFDYIAQVHKCVNEKNSVEIQYMIMNLYTRAYAESVMWLKKEDPTGQWCPATPWQLLIELKLMIQNYFFY